MVTSAGVTFPSRARGIPGVPTDIDPKLRTLLLALRQVASETQAGNIGGGGSSSGSSSGGSTIITVPGPSIPGGDDTPDLTPPPTPTNVAVLAGMDFVGITTDPPTFTMGHGYDRTIVYGAKRAPGAPAPVYGDAVIVHEFVGEVGTFPTDPKTTWHIWLKWRTVDGVLSVSPAGGTNGFVATTGNDITKLLEALTGSITESQLYADLGARIDLIDGMGPGSVNQRIDTVEANLSSSIATIATISNDANWTTWAGWEFESSLDGWVPVNITATTFRSALSTLATTNDPRLQKTLSAAEQFIGTRYPRVRMRARRVAGTPAGMDFSLLWATAGHGFTNAYRTGPIAIPASASDWYVYEWNLEAPTAGGTDWIDNTITALRIDLGNEVDSAWAIDWISIGKYGPGQARAVVQEEITTRASETGYLGAQYTLRMEVGNVIGGFGISGTSTPGAQPRIDFGIRANRFFIAPPAGVSGVPNLIPFAVQTTAYVDPVTGETLPPGVYMDAAYIRNLEASLGRFNNAIITNAMIVSLAVDKITAGSLSVGAYIQSSNYVQSTSGFRLSSDGILRAYSVDLTGTVRAVAGAIGGAVINATGVQSSNYSSSAGWRLDNASGDLIAHDATLRGSIKGGAFTGWAWPATGTGYYLGPEGLLLGNYNSGAFFQVYANGAVSASGFNIDAAGNATFTGTLTGADQVDTPQLVDGSVSVSGGQVVTYGSPQALSASYVQLASGPVANMVAGRPCSLRAGIAATWDGTGGGGTNVVSVWVRIRRGGTTLFEAIGNTGVTGGALITLPPMQIITPTNGTHTFSIDARISQTTSGGVASVSYASIEVEQLKR